MVDQPAIEHGSTRTGRWLRENRTRIAFAIAVVEGLMLVFGAVSRWGALAIAILVVAGYFLLAPRIKSPFARDVLWIAAVSQALVAMVPILVIVVGTLALIAVGILALVALIVLFGDRR